MWEGNKINLYLLYIYVDKSLHLVGKLFSNCSFYLVHKITFNLGVSDAKKMELLWDTNRDSEFFLGIW